MEILMAVVAAIRNGRRMTEFNIFGRTLDMGKSREKVSWKISHLAERRLPL
jgi:hypothetical protein